MRSVEVISFESCCIFLSLASEDVDVFFVTCFEDVQLTVFFAVLDHVVFIDGADIFGTASPPRTELRAKEAAIASHV
jgi:hypothetical protein